MSTKTHSASPPVALITGAATRIGAAIAVRLTSDGCKIVIHHNSSSTEAKALAAAITQTGGTAGLVRADLSSRKQRAGLIAAAAKLFGPLTILVNNASVFEADSVADLNEATWDRHFALHAEAPLFLARDFAAQLPKTTEGNIVNLVDERVLRLTPAYLSYTLSKDVLWTATRTLAQSLAPHIRVNAVGPGPTLPHKGQSLAAFKRAAAQLPLGHGAAPEDIADAVAFLIGARAITGQMLAVDGGRHLAFPPSNGPTPAQS